jgi:hypothetical protein
MADISTITALLGITTPADPCAEAPKFNGWNQAGAQAYYACKYLEAVKDTNKWNGLITIAQAITQFYFADKQYDIQKLQQDRHNKISDIELDRSGNLYNQFVKGISCEDRQLMEACGMVVEVPNIEDTRRRITADVKRAFASARKQIQDCFPANCVSAMCSELAKISREEAKAIVGVTSAYYQKEILLYEQRLATAKSWRYQVLAFGRGSVQSSTVLMEGASKNAALAGSINPYSGYIQAVNGAANTARSVLLQDALSYRGMGVNMMQQNEQNNTVKSQITGQQNSGFGISQNRDFSTGNVSLDSWNGQGYQQSIQTITPIQNQGVNLNQNLA